MHPGWHFGRKAPSLLTLLWRIFAEMESHIDKATEAYSIFAERADLVDYRVISGIKTHRQKRPSG